MVIDFHTHYFPDKVAPKVLPSLALKSTTVPFTDGTLGGLLRSMKEAFVTYSVTLPVVTAVSQTTSINDKIIENMEGLTQDGIIPFGGMHPDFADYKEELKRLSAAGVKGIKLHPAYQGVDFDDIRYMRILACAEELAMSVLIHAGIDIGIFDKNYASVTQIEKVLKEVSPTRLVLAHMGSWGRWDEFETYLAGAPVYIDSSFSVGPLVPYKEATPHAYSQCVLADEDFIRLFHAHGEDKVLFATDSPWQDQKKYIERFRNIGLTPEEQTNFFSQNAKRLLSL